MFESLVRGPQRVIIDIPAGHEVTICRTSGVRVQVESSVCSPRTWDDVIDECCEDLIQRFGPAPHPDIVIERVDLNKPLAPGNVRWVQRKSLESGKDRCRCQGLDTQREGATDESLDSDDVPDGMGD